MIHIGCITYKSLDKLVRQAVTTIFDPDVEITIIEGLREEIVEKTKRAIVQGTEILIAGGANAAIAEREFSLPVLRYKMTDFDYISAISAGCQMGQHVVIVTYQYPISKKLQEYLVRQHIQVSNLVYDDTLDLEMKIDAYHADVIIGAAHAVEIGERLGLRTVLIYPGTQSIVDTIGDAKVMAAEIRKVKERNQYAQTVMKYTTNGVLLIDAAGLISDHNESVFAILDIPRQALRGRKISDYIQHWDDGNFRSADVHEKSFIIVSQGREVLEKIIKIENSSFEFQGAVIILQKLSDIQKVQFEHAKRELTANKQRGFLAKKHFQDIIGTSYCIKACIDDAKTFAKSDSNVFLYGETGVGKDVFAQSIHNASRRASQPFIVINCSALTESLLEAELFGYDEGAFTGSRKGGKKGLFEIAEGGTVFLDEVGEISPLLQVKLLRVLQEHEIMRVGGDRVIPVNIRVIAATNRDLEHCSHEVFRRDLWYRLNVLSMNIPPLRERDEDQILLFDHFYKDKLEPNVSFLPLPEAGKRLIRLYDWPGNIREMQNVCERYCLFLAQIMKPRESDLVRCMIRSIGETKIVEAMLAHHQYAPSHITRELIDDLKNTLHFNRDRIAAILGVSRTTLWRISNQSEENVSKK
jgi:propionate catabolism operon transcriptional regulator